MSLSSGVKILNQHINSKYNQGLLVGVVLSLKTGFYTHIMAHMCKFLIFLLISGCASHIKLQHMEIEEHTGFLNKYVWIGIKGADGKIIPGTEKLTICPGYAGIVGDTMRNAAIIGSAALLGAGLGSSGDSNTTSNINRFNGGNATSTSGASSVSGARSAIMQKPYRELRPHEHKYYVVD